MLILFVASFVGCSNDDDNTSQDPIAQLPPATMTGENTFGFLLNGEPINVTNTTQQFAVYQQGQLQFGAVGIGINLNDPLNTNISFNLVDRARYQEDSNPQLGCQYQFSDTYQGSVIFTKIDTVNFIISGTFEFSTINEDCENIDITEGRFDLQYIP